MEMMLKQISLFVVATLAIPSPSNAEGINVGTVKSAQNCNYFLNVYYRQSQQSRSGAAVAAGPGGIAGAFASATSSNVEYMEYYTKDCKRNFPDAAATMNAVFSSIKLPFRENARLDVNISSVGAFDESKSVNPFGEELYAAESNGLQVRVDYSLYAAGSRKLDGGTIELRVSTFSSEDVPGQASRQSLDTRAAYNRVQGEIAKALAQRIVVKFDPLKISKVDGDRAIINRAEPIIKSGDLLSVIDLETARAYTLRVTTQSGGVSLAKSVNGENLPMNLVGVVVSPVASEAGDDVAPRQKVRLP